MKRRILALLVLAVMLVTLAGCAKKTKVSVQFPGIGDYTIVSKPEGFVNLSKQNGTLLLTVNKDGEYPFTIETDDGEQYSFVVKYTKGTAMVEAPDLDVIAGVS